MESSSSQSHEVRRDRRIVEKSIVNIVVNVKEIPIIHHSLSCRGFRYRRMFPNRHARPIPASKHITSKGSRNRWSVLPSIVAEQQPARGNEETDHNSRRRRARDIVGFLPAHGNGHGVGVEVVNPGFSDVESERLRVGEILVEVEGVEINGGTLGDSVWVITGWRMATGR